MGRFFVLILFTIILYACEKIEPPVDDLPMSYSFSNPVSIKITNPTNQYGGPVISQPTALRLGQEFIYGSHIYTGLKNENIGLYEPIVRLSVQRAPIGAVGSTSVFSSLLPVEYLDFGNTSDFGYYFPNFYSGNPVSVLHGNIPTLSLFSIDRNEQIVYILGITNNGEGIRILKWSIETGIISDLVTDLTQLNNLNSKQLKCMRIDDAGDLYIASMANNGSIIKISTIGIVTSIASNLINPGFFQIHEGNIYVPINSATEGRIVKFDKEGTRSYVITNLTGPTNVVIDNHKNIVVRSLTSVAGANYHRYDIYKPDGNFIANITDATGNSILSNVYENMPMYIDTFNNLYFYHADGIASGGATSNNPIGQKGIFKISLIKD
jgi:hypothetical protein